MSNEKDMDNIITDIQEITLHCCEEGIYTHLFEKADMSRNDILSLFAKWGEKFNEEHKDFKWDGSVSYYDEVDRFVENEFAEFTDPYIDQYGNHYDPDSENRSWPAGGGLHKDCDFNAEALYAYYTLKSKSKIWKYLTGREFRHRSSYSDEDIWEKGNTKITLSGYDFGAEQYGYLHTEKI